MFQKIGRFCIKLFSVVLFGALSALVVLYAYGYQFDLAKQNVKKTSIIDVSDNLQQVDVFLDGALQIHTLPYQIKNVLPGQHIIQVKKNGFLPWERKVKVKDDVVTLVRDVFLIPEKIEPYIEPLATLPSDYIPLLGRDFIIWYKPESRFLQIAFFNANGSIHERKIEVYREGLQDLKIVSPHYLLARFNDSILGLININDGGVKFFVLPPLADKVQFNEDSQTLYFLQEKRLLSAPLSSLRLQNEEKVDFKEIASDVDEYTPGFSGQIFFLSRGIFFTNDESRKITHIPEQDLSDFTNLSFKKAQNYGSLIVRTKEGRRRLYGVASNNQLTFLENDLKGQPFFNNLDQLLYFNTNNDLYFFDSKLLQKKFIPHSFEDEALLLGWITGEGSFLFKTNEEIKIADIADGQAVALLENQIPDEFFIFDKFFFYLKDKDIFVVDWRKDL